MPERIADAAELGEESVSAPWIEGLLEKFLVRGQILRALALLKVLSAHDPEGTCLLPHLESVLDQESLLDGEPVTTDPLATEFLGSDRAPVAWSILRRDGLSVRPAPGPKARTAPDQWTICHDPRSESPKAPHGLALVWHTTTTVPGKSRPAGKRKVCRRKMSLQGTVTFLSRSKKFRADRKYGAIIDDVSPAGVGIHLPNPHGYLNAEEARKCRIRLEISLPAQRQRIVTLAHVAWCVTANDQNGPILRMGIQFLEPPAEFIRTIRELIIQRKGDQQLLWNLWDTQAPRP
ncbi:MAG: PilZ domain-containing protein [Candidatus Eisenbacteria sp.]|nr:PilZ domain-containing protein [Candidatus Eisenbacteria bacterium]